MLRILTILALTLVFFISSRSVFAQQLDIAVSPLFFEYSTEKGATLSDKIRIQNNTDSPINLNISLQRLAPGQNSEASFSDPLPEDEYTEWVELENQTVTALPREWTDVPFTIDIPEDAAFGYYFAFLISQIPPEQEPGTASYAGGVAVPVLLSVQDPSAIIEGELIEFKTKSFINEYMPVEFTARIENKGNVHIKPRGNIFVKGLGGESLAILEINQAKGSILPNGQRSFESKWMDGFLVREPIIEDGVVLKDEKGNDRTKLSVNWNKLTDFRIGPYTANLLMVYDDGTRDIPLEATTTFWVVPYKIIAGILIVIVLLIFIVRKLLKAYIAKEIRKRQS